MKAPLKLARTLALMSVFTYGCSDQIVQPRDDARPPQLIAGATVQATASMLSAGQYHTCTIKPDSTVECWGNNANGESSPPAGLGAVKQVSAGGDLTCAIKADDTAVCWGTEADGVSTVPAGIGTVKQISAGIRVSCAIDSFDAAWCWGQNVDGQITPPPGLGAVKQIAAGAGYACVIKANDLAVCWGDNSFGAAEVPMDLGSVKQIDTYAWHSCAIKSNNTVACWGYNNSGQLDVPADLGSVKEINVGFFHTCAVKQDDTLVCWGGNGAGQSDVPFDIGTVKHTSAGSHHSCAIKTDDTVACWGLNGNGQSSPPSTTTRYAPSATFNVPPAAGQGTLFVLEFLDAEVVTADDTLNYVEAGIEYAFDCGDGAGYSPLSTTEVIACTAGAAGTQTVKGIVQDEDGDFTEYTATVTIIPPPPAAPSNFAGTLVNGTVELTWTDNATNENQYIVSRRRSVSGAWTEFVRIATIAADVTSYGDSTMQPGTTYSYRLRVCNAGGCEYVILDDIVVGLVPAAPSAATAVALTATSIGLQWTDNSNDETRFAIFRRSNTGSGWTAFTLQADSAANVEAHIDNTVTRGNSYQYQLRACNAAGCSALASSAIVRIPPRAPAAPTGFTVSATSPTSVELAWTDASNNEGRFEIMRRQFVGGSWTPYTPLVQTSPNATSYVETGAESGATYRYRLVACNVVGCSSVVVSSTVTTP